ncbi:MAG: IclR family transcriptional regulator [Chloroflexota bacterium]
MINSVYKAITIMKLFNEHEPRLSLAQISRRLDMPKSTAHNLLNTLAMAGMIEKVDGDSYALGTEIIALTQNVRVNVELRDRAAPLLRALADSCNETVYLAVKDGDALLYIYAIESSQRLLARSAVGDRVPLHCTSLGKAILAELPQATVREIIERAGMPTFTEFTIASLEELEAELAQIRAQGYALDRQEHEYDTYCIGAPIFDARGRIVAACSISGADPNIIDANRESLAAALVQTAHEISRRMGYVPSTLSRNAHVPERK